jgi:hypothetical protein
VSDDVSWDRFLSGFDSRAEPRPAEPAEPPILTQLVALHDERVERADPTWFPPGPDPDGLERLVEERRRRGTLR